MDAGTNSTVPDFPPEIVSAYQRAIREQLETIRTEVEATFKAIEEEVLSQNIESLGEGEGDSLVFYGGYHFNSAQVEFLNRHFDLENKRIVIPINSHTRELIHNRVVSAQQQAGITRKSTSDELLNQELLRYASEIGFVGDAQGQYLSIDASEFIKALRLGMEKGLKTLLDVSIRQPLNQLNQKAITALLKQREMVSSLGDSDTSLKYTPLETSLIGNEIAFTTNGNAYIIFELTGQHLVIRNPKDETLSLAIYDDGKQYDLMRENGLPFFSRTSKESVLGFYLGDLDNGPKSSIHIGNLKLANPLKIAGEQSEISFREVVFPITEICKFITTYLEHIHLEGPRGGLGLPIKFDGSADMPLRQPLAHGIFGVCRFRQLDTQEHVRIVREYELEVTKRETQESVKGLTGPASTSLLDYLKKRFF